MESGNINSSSGTDGKGKTTMSTLQDHAVPVNENTFMANAVSNDVILGELFKLFDIESLLQFSLVSKNWCAAARSTLRSQKKCLAQIPGVRPCYELLQLNEVLRSSTDSPFSGLAIRTCRPSRKSERFPLGRDSDYEYYSDNEQDAGTSSSSGMLRGRVIPVEGSDSDVSSSPDHACCLADDEDDNDDSGVDWDDLLMHDSDDDEPFIPDDMECPTLTPVTPVPIAVHDCTDMDITVRYGAILGLTVRNLEVYWDVKRPCPAQQLLVKILKEQNETLEELKITRWPSAVPNVGEFLEMTERKWLKSLRVLDLDDCPMPDNFSSAKYELILAAPVLEKVRGVNRLPDLEFFLDRQIIHKIQQYDFFYPSILYEEMLLHDTEENLLLRFAASRPRLGRFLFLGSIDPARPRRKLKFIQTFFRLLFENVSDSLREFQINQNHLLLLAAPIFLHPFSKLKALTLGLSKTMDAKLGCSSLPRFNWTHWFPQLTTVEIFINPLMDNEELNKKLLIFKRTRTKMYSCPTVRKLILSQRFSSYSSWHESLGALAYFKTLFPNIKDFVLDGCCRLDMIFKFLWNSWTGLETISLSMIKISAVQHNLDHLFCGISREKANQLRWNLEDGSFDGLEPDLPCLLSMKDLKKLRVEIVHLQPCSVSKYKKNNAVPFFLTDLTQKLVLSQMPQLRIEILRDVCKGSTPCAYKFDQMKPFARILNSLGK